MAELNYEDSKRRTNIQDLLADDGYCLNRRDGLRYPSYVKMGSDGQPSIVTDGEGPKKNFDLKGYERLECRRDDWDGQKAFYPYFKSRGINLDTQRAFGNNFFIAMRETSNGKTYTNLAFPLRNPNDLGTIVGLEERDRANAEGEANYKGMAAGSNATEGLWIACPAGDALDKVKDVYWFECAYDAMAFYQITKSELKNGENRDWERKLPLLDESVFVSTGGYPGTHQFKGMIAETPEANHHLCFDRDGAGRVLAINFALTKAGKVFNTYVTPKGKLIVTDNTDKYQRYELNLEPFEFDRLLKILGADTQRQGREMTEYMESLRNKKDILSGDEYLLPPDLLKAYGRYEVACEDFHSAKYSRLVCQEDLEDLRDGVKTSYDAYQTAMKDAVAHYESTGRIIYHPCEKGYKDWNDQLLGKRIAAEEDCAADKASGNSAAAGYGPEARDEENNEEEERAYHCHR